MAKRITVVLSQGQSNNPAKRSLEEEIVAALLMERGIEVTVIPNLYDLKPDGTGMLCLQGISGDMIVLSWLFPRAAHWIMDRNGILGRVGETMLVDEDDENDEDDEDEAAEESEAEDKQRVVDQREVPPRTIYCLDLRCRNRAQPFVEEIRRIAKEATTEVVDLMGWIGGSPKPEQLDRYLQPAGGNGSAARVAANPATSASPATASSSPPDDSLASAPAQPKVIDETPQRRWYPVIDFARCTNCMECIDFCLFGVYGVDAAETILVEQPDNCRKGCPACSRVCPENAIIFPQHKTPTIAGSPEVGGVVKIDLSQLFGAPEGDSLRTAVAERDEQLVLAGRDSVGMSVGIAKRQQGKSQAPKDDLDDLIDAADDLDV